MVDRQATATLGTVDALLAGRYRLTELVHQGRTELWRAEDTVLARSVAVRLLTADDAELRASFLAAAAQAGRYPGPGVASVLDAATEAVGNQELTFVVSGWIEGPPLVRRLAAGPLDLEESTRIVESLCVTLTNAHEAGVFARRLHPGHVLVPALGEPIVVDLEVTAVLHEMGDQKRRAEGASGMISAHSHAELVRTDTEDLARVLYSCVTGCWPSSSGTVAATAGVTVAGTVAGTAGGSRSWAGLPEAPQRDGRLLLPRQVRAGLPRALDLIIAQTLEPQRRPNDRPIGTPAELRNALVRLTSSMPVAATVIEEDDAVARRPRRLVRAFLAVLVLAVLATGGLLLGLVVGRVPANAPTASKVPGLHASPSAGAVSVAQPLTLSAVNSFDPQGDNREDDSRVVYATDGDDATAWTTEQYKQVDFGGSGKMGVGLLVDLGSAKSVSRVVLTAPPGQTIEILAAPGATTRPTTESATATPAVSDPVVTASKGDTTLTVQAGTSSRWYVVWITGLTKLAGSPAYGGTIQEMAFYG